MPWQNFLGLLSSDFGWLSVLRLKPMFHFTHDSCMELYLEIISGIPSGMKSENT